MGDLVRWEKYGIESTGPRKAVDLDEGFLKMTTLAVGEASDLEHTAVHPLHFLCALGRMADERLPVIWALKSLDLSHDALRKLTSERLHQLEGDPSGILTPSAYLLLGVAQGIAISRNEVGSPEHVGIALFARGDLDAVSHTRQEMMAAMTRASVQLPQRLVA